MSYYNMFQKLAFLLPEETAHDAALYCLKCSLLVEQKKKYPNIEMLHNRLLNTTFGTPIGLAAGFDKDGVGIKNLFQQGFGFIEVGTVTPKPQAGNNKPRLFRLAEDEAIINRMGFNNNGIDALIPKVRKENQRGIIGINIGKNKDSEDAIADYVYCLNQAYGAADYITINISSPNTLGLRELEKSKNLTGLLDAVTHEVETLQKFTDRKTLLILKISPDISNTDLKSLCKNVLKYNIHGLIVGNTTKLERDGLRNQKHAKEDGGLSGKPLMDRSTNLLKQVYELTEGKIPIIGVGGIFSGDDAYKKIKAGASLVQIYTSLIYKGFGIIPEIEKRLIKLLQQDGYSNINQAIGADVKN